MKNVYKKLDKLKNNFKVVDLLKNGISVLTGTLLTFNRSKINLKNPWFAI